MSANDQSPNEGSLSAAFDIDHYHLIPTNAKVHRIKVPRYKEIKHYIKGEVLGRGQFGTVREFVDKYTLKRYAGKIIRKWVLKRDEHLCRAINKELAISYHFDHPNILRVYDLFVASCKVYMFMEFCYGELSEFMTFHPSLPKCQSKDFFGQICEGLDYLHSRGVIHRDIKPENVLVSHLNQLKLADFGVCESVDIFSENDMVVGSDGSPFYHSPEVFNRNVLSFSGSKVDIWAAALILLHMITGFEFCKKFVLNPSDNVHYPHVVRGDILLHDLFNKLFKKDFRQRISIAEIRKHSWMQIKCNQVSEHYKTFPTERRDVDFYRGLTVMTRIHEKFFPTSISEAEKLVDQKTREESKKPLALFRSNRLTATKKKAHIQPARVNFNS